MTSFLLLVGTLTTCIGYNNKDALTLATGLTITNASLNMILYKYETGKYVSDENEIFAIPIFSGITLTTTYLSYNFLTGPQSYKFK